MTDDQPKIVLEPVEVNFEHVLDRFAGEIAVLTRRAVVAETQVLALQQQVALQKIMLTPPPPPETTPAPA